MSAPAYAVTATVAAALVATLISGCGAADRVTNDLTASPMTPEQSKAQVIDAAKEIVGILNLPVVSAYFWRSSCNDQGDPPFRGSMRVAYPLAPSFEASQKQVEHFLALLREQGWTAPGPDFHTHGKGLIKDGVSATFGPQAVGLDTNAIELLGECGDVTTTREAAPGGEDINLS